MLDCTYCTFSYMYRKVILFHFKEKRIYSCKFLKSRSSHCRYTHGTIYGIIHRTIYGTIHGWGAGCYVAVLCCNEKVVLIIHTSSVSKCHYL